VEFYSNKLKVVVCTFISLVGFLCNFTPHYIGEQLFLKFSGHSLDNSRHMLDLMLLKQSRKHQTVLTYGTPV